MLPETSIVDPSSFDINEGSHAWGLAGPDSDHDVKEPAWYLQLEEGRDVIDKSLGDLDLNGWDIRKAMRMLRDSNCSILTWLHSESFYFKNDAFVNDALTLGMDSISWKCLAFHFLNKAKKHMRGKRWEIEIIEKKYFFVLHPLLSVEWMRQKKIFQLPPVQFTALLNEIDVPEDVKVDIMYLVRLKLANKTGTGMRYKKIDDWIELTLALTEKYAAKELVYQKPALCRPFNEVIAKYVLVETVVERTS